jgi:hypothetical protein
LAAPKLQATKETGTEYRIRLFFNPLYHQAAASSLKKDNNSELALNT